ncbi:MAG: glutamine amidotransferase [Eubacterium sp.]|nr:glutamine amidotransferase [Eubacterium sp.]MBR7060823.1 glutamine amidotransferase [Eubacterium sp.]
MKKITIAHLYPKELNLYGDIGNIICLQYRLAKRGISSEVIGIEAGDRLCDFDILVIGGGQDKEMEIIAPDIRKKGEMLSYCIESGKTVFAVCAGFQLLGKNYIISGKKELRLSGALDFSTVAGDERKIGNIVFESPFGLIAGFENHSGKTYLPNKFSPLGKVIRGFGNNGEDKGEGLLYKNTFATYAHGAVLPKNPALADEIIKRALKCETLSPLDDEVENKCHNQLIHIS